MDKKKVVLRYNLVSVRFYLTMPQFPSDIISEPVSLCHIFPRTYFFLLNFLSELPSLLDITSQPSSFCPFYLITLFFVSYFISKSFFLPDLTSQPQTLCHILPQYIQLSKFTFVLHYFCQIFPLNLLLCQFSPQNCYFLSSFTSEPPSFCRFYLRILFLPDCTSVSSTFYQILPQNHLVSVKFYLKTSNFLSDFAPKLLYVWFYLESTNICQILPQNPLLSFRFYLRTSFLLSVFISEPPSFCQILPQSPLFCVTFYLKASKFVSHFTSQSDIFYQMVPQNLFGCHFYLRTSSVCQILPQNVFLFFRFSREPFFFLSDFTSGPLFFFLAIPQNLPPSFIFISKLPSSASSVRFYLRTSFFSIRFNLKFFYFIQKSVRYTPTQTRKIIPILYLPPLVLSVLLSCSAKKNFKPGL